MFIERRGPLLLRSGYKKHSNIKQPRNAGLWQKNTPPHSPHHHPYPDSHPRHGSLVYLSSSWGTDSLEWKGTEVLAATEITPNTGANVQDAGIKSSSGALFPPHFYLLALFWRAANWASALQLRCRSFKNISFHKSNSDVPKRAWGGAEEVTETNGSIMESKPNSHSRDRSRNHSKSGQRVRMQSWNLWGRC